jgi:hypothetical protein
MDVKDPKPTTGAWMIKQLFAVLLNAEAPPAGPADPTTDPTPSDPSRDRAIGWLGVAILGVLILGALIAIGAAIFGG